MLDTFSLLDDILAHIGVVVNREVAFGNHHHMIIALVARLVATQLCTFMHNARVLLNENNVLHVELEFFESYLHCTRCFALEHVEVDYTYHYRRLIGHSARAIECARFTHSAQCVVSAHCSPRAYYAFCAQ